MLTISHCVGWSDIDYAFFSEIVEPETTGHFNGAKFCHLNDQPYCTSFKHLGVSHFKDGVLLFVRQRIMSDPIQKNVILVHITNDTHVRTVAVLDNCRMTEMPDIKTIILDSDSLTIVDDLGNHTFNYPVFDGVHYGVLYFEESVPHINYHDSRTLTPNS